MVYFSIIFFCCKWASCYKLWLILKCVFLSSLTLFNLAEKPEAQCEGKARSTDTVECVSECINKWAASRVPPSTRSICSRQAVGYHGNTRERKRRRISLMEREREELSSLTMFPRNSVAWPSALLFIGMGEQLEKRNVERVNCEQHKLNLKPT